MHVEINYYKDIKIMPYAKLKWFDASIFSELFLFGAIKILYLHVPITIISQASFVMLVIIYLILSLEPHFYWYYFEAFNCISFQENVWPLDKNYSFR